MKIRDLLAADRIELHTVAKDKAEVLNRLVELMEKSGKLRDTETYRRGVFAREAEGTTGIGEGVAIPHCKSSAVISPGLAAMVIPGGVEYDSLDGEPVKLIFLIAAPDSEENVHLEVLSRLSVLLMDEAFIKNLLQAKSTEAFLRIIDEAEEAGNRKEQEIDFEPLTEDDNGWKKQRAEADRSAGGHSCGKAQFLAVTACPTGIAHTYMAAEALEKAARKAGYVIKVETRGSGGAKNVLTNQEIAEADCIIVAADTKVPMERFQGKRVIQCRVADGIAKAGELLERAAAGEGERFQIVKSGSRTGGGDSDKAGTEADNMTGNPSGRTGYMIYKHLMNGVSHMLPFVIGGGILIAIAFLIDTLLGYGVTGGGNFGSCTPLSAFFQYVGSLSMGMMVPVLAGYIAYSIADRPGLAVGFAGGLLASGGNALAESYHWFGEAAGAQKFIADYAFQAPDGGNTVSGFLGGIAAGFLAGYLVLFLRKIFSRLPDSLEGIKPTLLYPLLGIFLVSVLMVFLFNPLIGMINTALGQVLSGLSAAGFIVVLGLLLGAMMAIDMGGPINKAAYVFGTGMLATAADLQAGGAAPSDPAVLACYLAMASIMVGGMVPPTGIALACFLFPKKFTKAEKSSRISNLVMGCSFITEGAIPFAAADPVKVIPACMAGAGVAGLLSAWFGCTLMAPHGGVFVFATVGNPLRYLAAWMIGSVVTALLLGTIKKNGEASD